MGALRSFKVKEKIDLLQAQTLEPLEEANQQ
jgi:hypothetical protein